MQVRRAHGVEEEDVYMCSVNHRVNSDVMLSWDKETVVVIDNDLDEEITDNPANLTSGQRVNIQVILHLFKSLIHCVSYMMQTKFRIPILIYSLNTVN